MKRGRFFLPRLSFVCANYPACTNYSWFTQKLIDIALDELTELPMDAG